MQSETSIQAKQRVDPDHWAKRLKLEAEHAAVKFDSEGMTIHWENVEAAMLPARWLLRLIGLYGRGRRNTLDLKVEEIELSLRNLPDPFDNLRVLHLSDLHIDGMIDGGDKLWSLVEGLDYDLCVMTGDFRFATFGPYDETLRRMERLVRSIQCTEGIFGILGNHDSMEMVSHLEAMGIRMLLNESVPIERDGDSVWIAGVDDTHYYRMHDLPKALEGVPEEAASILLAHSPEIIEQAAACGVDYYLSGHTHGGQICCPGGIPIIKNARCRRKYASGPWNYGSMQGYTSRGTGSSALTARFFCPPEITLHTLRCPVRELAPSLDSAALQSLTHQE